LLICPKNISNPPTRSSYSTKFGNLNTFTHVYLNDISKILIKLYCSVVHIDSQFYIHSVYLALLAHA